MRALAALVAAARSRARRRARTGAVISLQLIVNPVHVLVMELVHVLVGLVLVLGRILIVKPVLVLQLILGAILLVLVAGAVLIGVPSQPPPPPPLSFLRTCPVLVAGARLVLILRHGRLDAADDRRRTQDQAGAKQQAGGQSRIDGFHIDLSNWLDFLPMRIEASVGSPCRCRGFVLLGRVAAGMRALVRLAVLVIVAFRIFFGGIAAGVRSAIGVGAAPSSCWSKT